MGESRITTRNYFSTGLLNIKHPPRHHLNVCTTAYIHIAVRTTANRSPSLAEHQTSVVSSTNRACDSIRLFRAYINHQRKHLSGPGNNRTKAGDAQQEPAARYYAQHQMGGPGARPLQDTKAALPPYPMCVQAQQATCWSRIKTPKAGPMGISCLGMTVPIVLKQPTSKDVTT